MKKVMQKDPPPQHRSPNNYYEKSNAKGPPPPTPLPKKGISTFISCNWFCITKVPVTIYIDFILLFRNL